MLSPYQKHQINFEGCEQGIFCGLSSTPGSVVFIIPSITRIVLDIWADKVITTLNEVCCADQTVRLLCDFSHAENLTTVTPYLSGKFEEIMANFPTRTGQVAIVLPNRVLPYRMPRFAADLKRTQQLSIAVSIFSNVEQAFHWLEE